MKMVALMCALTGALCYMSLHADDSDDEYDNAGTACQQAPIDYMWERECLEDIERMERQERERRERNSDGGLGRVHYECMHAVEYYMSATH